jgi:site-specific recombinase XerD
LLEKYLNETADRVSPDELKHYLYYRISAGISYSNVNISCNAFKLFFNKVLKYNWSDDVIIRPKKPKKFPCVLSKNEILAIIDQVDNLMQQSYSPHYLLFRPAYLGNP